MTSPRRVSHSQFLGYLDKLRDGQPVNEPHFLRGAEQFDLDISELGAERVFVKGNLCRYLGCNPEVLQAWQRKLAEPHVSPRVNGASRGHSHGAQVSGAMLTVRNRHQRHPQVILVEGHRMQFPGLPARYAVIVENLENFLELDATLQLLPACGLPEAWQDADILFGSGNSVTNQLLTRVFQCYHEVGCLFDPDPGGVRMFDTLYQRADMPALRFLAPEDIEERLKGACNRITSQDRQGLATYMQRTPPVARIAGLIRQHGRHLEQETYLIPATPASKDAS